MSRYFAALSKHEKTKYLDFFITKIHKYIVAKNALRGQGHGKRKGRRPGQWYILYIKKLNVRDYMTITLHDEKRERCFCLYQNIESKFLKFSNFCQRRSNCNRFQHSHSQLQEIIKCILIINTLKVNDHMTSNPIYISRIEKCSCKIHGVMNS